MAMAERILNARFGDELVDHKTYVIASDGDLMEGISHEAISLAGHLKLTNLIVLWDDNNITIDGATSLSEFHRHRSSASRRPAGPPTNATAMTRPMCSRARAPAQTADSPVLIACRTIIGFGMPDARRHAEGP